MSRICLASATFGVAPSPPDAVRVVHGALDLGINFFDKADSYGASSVFDRHGVPSANDREPAEDAQGSIPGFC